MNKFPFIMGFGQYKGKTPPPKYNTGWTLADAVIKRSCQKCGCGQGFHCETPSGRRALAVHTVRVKV